MFKLVARRFGPGAITIQRRGSIAGMASRASASTRNEKPSSKYQPRLRVDKNPSATVEKGFITDFIRNRLSPAYFTGRPEYFDNMRKLDNIISNHKVMITGLEADLPVDATTGASTDRWLTKPQLEDLWGAKLSGVEYQSIIDRLNRLYLLDGRVSDPVLRQLLGRFRAVKAGGQRQSVRQVALDENGCAYATGYRRRVRAHVWMSECQEPGEGRVMIDGEDYRSTLERFKDRSIICKPFEVTDTIGKYNVWCEIEASQPNAKGASGALANAIANALLVHDPSVEKWLRKVDLIEPDERQRERKKPGQPSARAKFHHSDTLNNLDRNPSERSMSSSLPIQPTRVVYKQRGSRGILFGFALGSAVSLFAVLATQSRQWEQQIETTQLSITRLSNNVKELQTALGRLDRLEVQTRLLSGSSIGRQELQQLQQSTQLQLDKIARDLVDIHSKI